MYYCFFCAFRFLSFAHDHFLSLFFVQPIVQVTWLLDSIASFEILETRPYSLGRSC